MKGRSNLVVVLILLAIVAGAGAYLWKHLRPGGSGDGEWRQRPATPAAARPPYDFSGRPVGKAPAGAPNVILITIDSLRPDHLGCYGYERPTSPNIDRLASEGTLFETAISTTSWTLPSHMSIFTSLYDSVHGVYDNHNKMVLDHPMLAEVMQEAGYKTAGFYSAPNTYPEWGFHLGFDDYFNCTSYPRDDDQTWSEPKDPVFRRTTISWADITNPTIHESVTGWLGEREGEEEPWFAFIHYWDVHHDYIPPEPYDTMFDPGYEGILYSQNLQEGNTVHPNMAPGDLHHLIALYDGEIRWTDEWIGKLVTFLEDKGMLENTLLVITADHGEEFFEHGEKAHAKNLFDETIRVPMIFRLPGKVKAGLRPEMQIRTIDIYPTVLDLVGVDRPEGLLGRSVAPVLEGREEAVDLPPAFSELYVRLPRLRTFRTREWKIIEFFETGQAHFYDLTVDPGEQGPRLLDAGVGETGSGPGASGAARAARALMKEHFGAISALRRALEETAGDSSIQVDPETLARLRSMGYAK